MIYVGQIVDPEDFIGRESMIREVHARLKHIGFTEIIGPSLSGKTSLAHAISQRSELLKEHITFIDLQRTEGKLAQIDALSRQTPNFHRILIVDEVDVVCEKSESFFHWSRLLRTLGERPSNVSILSISQRSYDVYCHKHGLRESRARGRPLYMQPPHRTACRQLTRSLLMEGGVQSQMKQHVNFVERIAGCHPYLIETVAQRLIDEYRNGGESRYKLIGSQLLLQCKNFFYDIIKFVYDESDDVDPALAILFCSAIADTSAFVDLQTRRADSERIRKLKEKLPYQICESLSIRTGIVSFCADSIRPFSPILTWLFLRYAAEGRFAHQEETLLHMLGEKNLTRLIDLAKQRLNLLGQADTFFHAEGNTPF